MNPIDTKLLVVDDEQSIVELVSVLLSDAGFDVTTAYSGSDALEKLKAATPDLILMDMMLPEMTGTQVIEKIRQDPTTKDLKIAMLTVVKPGEIGEETLNRIGISDFIPKPFENEDLIYRVKKILD